MTDTTQPPPRAEASGDDVTLLDASGHPIGYFAAAHAEAAARVINTAIEDAESRGYLRGLNEALGIVAAEYADAQREGLDAHGSFGCAIGALALETIRVKEGA